MPWLLKTALLLFVVSVVMVLALRWIPPLTSGVMLECRMTIGLIHP